MDVLLIANAAVCVLSGIFSGVLFMLNRRKLKNEFDKLHDVIMELGQNVNTIRHTISQQHEREPIEPTPKSEDGYMKPEPRLYYIA